MITESTPPFPIPQPDTSWFAQLLPSSGVEGALALVSIVAGAALVGLLLKFFWPQSESPAVSTDTPETDEAVGKWAVRKDATELIKCSRRLERRLTQANERVEAKQDAYSRCADQLTEANTEIARLRRAREE